MNPKYREEQKVMKVDGDRWLWIQKWKQKI